MSAAWHACGLEWQTLLHGVYDIDALECPACGGRLSFLELVTDHEHARTIVDRLRLDTEPPPVASPSTALDLVDPLNDHDLDQQPSDWDP